MRKRFSQHLLSIALLTLAACGSSDSSQFSESTPTDVRTLVETLAADELQGRDNQTPGSTRAQQLLIDELSRFAEPAFPDRSGNAAYLQSYDVGANVLAVVPGGDLADEYLLIGAHYDHLGLDCDDITADDTICNGAADNATGIAAVIDIVRSIQAQGTPRRSIIMAFWDNEEDNFEGSRHYVANPIVPLNQTISYVNFDIQGTNLLPSLRNFTILVGAETGGPNLVDIASRAREETELDTVILSLLFGQGRSDHAVLVDSGVPAVFFTDANNGCYHTVKDDIDAVDFPKLEQQIRTAAALTRELVQNDNAPSFDTSAALVTYQDAVELLRIVESAAPDFALLGADAQNNSEQFLSNLQIVVGAGEAAFDNAAIGTLLGGAQALVSAMAAIDCDPFL